MMDSTTSDGRDAAFDAQLASMIRARDEGLIAGIGLSNISLDHLRRALASTDIVCVQNSFSLVDRGSTPVLRECVQRGIAFVPFLPLGWPRESRNTILENPTVVRIAQRYDATPTQIALAWLTGLAESILLIPGTSSLKHLRENIAVDRIALDEDAMAQLDTAFPYHVA
jgi:diketogulonate reductase-like aldo/keto reductase